jgi:hypothetical protein
MELESMFNKKEKGYKKLAKKWEKNASSSEDDQIGPQVPESMKPK